MTHALRFAAHRSSERKSFLLLRNIICIAAKNVANSSVSDKIRRGLTAGMVAKKLAKLFYVTGAVQGVGYRYFTQRVSARIGVAGYVKNLRDGRVEVYAIGSAPQLSELRLELERGPHGASVREVFDEDAAVEEKYANSFSIEHDGW
jgi:acylphosphatase